MKKKLFLVFSLLFLVVIIAGCKGSGVKVDGKKIYKTEITSVKEDSDYDWKVKGKTDAPDGAKILVLSSDKEDYEHYAINYGDGNWAKVDDGKFTVAISPTDVELDSESEKSGSKVKVYIVAIEGYSEPWDSSVPSAIVRKIRSEFEKYTLKISSSQAKYNSDDEDYEDTDDENVEEDYEDNDDEKDSETSSLPTEDSDYQSVTYDQLARTPDDFEGKAITISGTVLQSIVDDDGDSEMIVDATGNGDVLCVVELNKNGTRFLEGDSITIYGKSGGLTSYESSGSGTVTAPLIGAIKIE